MNGDEETIGLMEFIRLFTLPGEPQEPVTLEGKAWDEERGMAVPSGEMMTWTPRHPPQPVRQIVPGINPPPIKGDLQVSTVWDRDQKRCVFNFYRPQEAIEPEFIVDERGVRSLLPDVAEMSSLLLPDEEQLVLLEEAQACHLTWPVSLKKVLAWAERMGYEVAGIDEDERFSTGEGGDGQVAMVASPAVHCRLAAKLGRPPTPGMNEAVRDLELRWNKAKKGEDTTPVLRKRGLATEIAKERWPGITELERNSHINTLLSRTRAGASVSNEGDIQREGKSEEDPKHMFLSSPPPLSLK